MATNTDKFGVWCRYQTKDSNEFYLPANMTKPAGEKDEQTIGEYYQFINRIRGIGGKDTSSNDMHFKKPILNVEATGYFKVIENMNDVSVKLRGGHHSNDGNDSAKCYIFRVGANGTGKNFAKEFPHWSDKGHDGYSWRTLTTGFNPGSLKGKWVGLKAITWNEGNDKVHCECYLDLDGVNEQGKFDTQKQQWKIWYNVVDGGKDGVIGDVGPGKRNTKTVWTTLQQNSTVQFRVDAETGMKMEYSYIENDRTFQLLSVREINI